MRKVSWRQGSAAVGAAVAGVLVTASVAWACAPGPIGSQWEFIVTPQSAQAGTTTPDPTYTTPTNPDPTHIPSTYVGGNDSAERTAASDWVVSGYLTGQPTYTGTNSNKLFLGDWLGAAPQPLPASNSERCETTDLWLSAATVVVQAVPQPNLMGNRSVIEGVVTIPANAKPTDGVYLVCSGARIDLWYDTVSLL